MLYLNYIQELIKTAVDAIKAVSDLIPDGGAMTSIAQESTVGTPAGASVSADIAAVKTVVDGIASSSGTPQRKTVTFSNTTGVVNLFTVTGFVRVKVYARCKTAVASVGGTNGSLGVVDEAAGFIADTDMTALAAGEVWKDTSPTEKLNMYNDAVFDYVLSDGQDVILTLSAQADSGVMEFAAVYEALSSDGAVVAA